MWNGMFGPLAGAPPRAPWRPLAAIGTQHVEDRCLFAPRKASEKGQILVEADTEARTRSSGRWEVGVSRPEAERSSAQNPAAADAGSCAQPALAAAFVFDEGHCPNDRLHQPPIGARWRAPDRGRRCPKPNGPPVVGPKVPLSFAHRTRPRALRVAGDAP